MANDNSGNGLAELEKRLWAAVDQRWVNSGLTLLRFIDSRFRVEDSRSGCH